MIIDMHCDTISEIRHRRTLEGEACRLEENTLHIDARRLKDSGYLLQCFALFVSLRGCGALREQGEQPSVSRPDLAWEEVRELHRVYRQELECCGKLLQSVESAKDLEQCRRTGKVGALLTVEEGGVCGGSLDRLEELYDMGVRMLTLTWNFPNELGHPNINALDIRQGYPSLFLPDTLHGLTDRGRDFVARMGELGMLVDVSHLSDKGFWDVAEVCGRPFVASHSNCRALASHPRNLTDEMIRALAERGGVAGINFCAAFLRDAGAEETYQHRAKDGTRPAGGQKEARVAYIRDMVRHIRHMEQIGGIGVIGLGTDFDGIGNQVEIQDASQMQLLAQAMEQEGFTIGEIEAVFYGNVLRVYKEILS